MHEADLDKDKTRLALAGNSGDKRRKLTAFTGSYSATGGTRTRRASPIEYEYECRSTKYANAWVLTSSGMTVSIKPLGSIDTGEGSRAISRKICKSANFFSREQHVGWAREYGNGN